MNRGFPPIWWSSTVILTIGLSEHGKGHQGSEVYIVVDDIASWHRRCVDNHITPEHAPKQMPWGNTEMLLKDPFRNALRFTQEGTHEGAQTRPTSLRKRKLEKARIPDNGVATAQSAGDGSLEFAREAAPTRLSEIEIQIQDEISQQ